MALEIARRLIGGVWRTGPVEEANGGGGGGGSQPVQAIYEGDPISVANGGGGTLPFTTLDSGTDLLDRTTPDAPMFLEDGTYALTLWPAGDDSTPGGSVSYHITVGSFSVGATDATAPFNSMLLPLVIQASAGDSLTVTVINNAATQNFNLQGSVIVKLA